MTEERAKASEEVIVILRRELGSENADRNTHLLPFRKFLSWIRSWFA